MESWRLIMDCARSGAENMAVDEAVLTSVRSGASPPTVRLYGWNEPTLTLGYGQSSRAFSGWPGPVVRRITGGRAVLHNTTEVTYSVACGGESALLSLGIDGAYRAVSRCIVDALRGLGISVEFAKGDRSGARGAGSAGRRAARSEACFKSAARYEVLAGGRKLAGSAQRRFKDGFLQHGSIVMELDVPLTETLFGPGVAEHVASVSEFSDYGRKEVVEALRASFEAGLAGGASFEAAPLTVEESELTRRLLSSRYSARKWNLSPNAVVTKVADTRCA